MRIHSPISRRGFVFSLASVLLVLAVVDGGSVLLARISVADQARGAGYAATAAVTDQPATAETVRLAFEAARDDARARDISISTKSFTLYPDGRVTLTARRTAPTLLLNRISALSHLAQVRATVTVTALPFS